MPRGQNPQITEFSKYLRHRRRELQIPLSELESRTGIHNSRLSRWERGIEMPDRPERLSALARGLDVDLADLYALAGIELPTTLPTLRPYLRSKYGSTLPADALDEIARYSDYIAARHGVVTGPRPGEDEIGPPRRPEPAADEHTP
ncbi:MAG TPA: helix-turn-helix transcriptional regulator [Acidimicrobiales bacterium]|nr:helix-turn-helix transcriptional regulator [Acidimicrobiales bacterium]